MAINWSLPTPESGMDAFLKSLKEGADVRNTWAKTAEQEAKNPYVGPKSLADLINQQNINKYYAPNIKSEMGLRNANAALDWQKYNNPALAGTGLEHQIAAYEWMQKHHPEMAEKYKNEVIQSQQAQPNVQGAKPDNLMEYVKSNMGQRNQPVKAPNATMNQEQPANIPNVPQQQPSAQPQPQQPNIQDLYLQNINADLAEKEAKARYYAQGGGRSMGVNSKELQDMSRQIQLENPDFTPEQINDARSAYLEGRETLTDGTPLPPPSGSMQSMLEANYKRRSDVGQRAQERYAATLKEAISRADENAKSAVKFAGGLGSATGSLEKAKSILGGENSKDYQNFNNFVTVDVPTMAGEYMRQLGVNASDQQKAMYKEVVNPVNWYTSPKLALAQWNYFKGLAKDLGVTISESAAKRHNKLQNEAGYGAKGSQGSYVSPKIEEGEQGPSPNVVRWGKDAKGNPIKLGS